jgi:hypothetical protein
VTREAGKRLIARKQGLRKSFFAERRAATDQLPAAVGLALRHSFTKANHCCAAVSIESLCYPRSKLLPEGRAISGTLGPGRRLSAPRKRSGDGRRRSHLSRPMLSMPSLGWQRCRGTVSVHRRRSTVRSDDPTTSIRMVLRGARSVGTNTQPTASGMPSYGWQLDDSKVARTGTGA